MMTLRVVSTRDAIYERAPIAPLDPIDVERSHGVRRALDQLGAGRPGRAHYELVRSVMRQARIAGLGDVPVALPCPCGGRCGR